MLVRGGEGVGRGGGRGGKSMRLSVGCEDVGKVLVHVRGGGVGRLGGMGEGGSGWRGCGLVIGDDRGADDV